LLPAAAVGAGFALVLAHAQCALAQDSAKAQDPAQRAMQDGAQSTEATMPVAAADPRKQDGMRRTITGSNILRVRSEDSLPLMEVDRTYIDRSGVSTTTELLRTVPQIQISR